MQIPLSDAIEQIREEIRVAQLSAKDKEIIFTPEKIDLEFGVNFRAEATGSGKFKILALIDLSTEAKASRESEHRVRITLSVTDQFGNSLKIASGKVPTSLP